MDSYRNIGIQFSVYAPQQVSRIVPFMWCREFQAILRPSVGTRGPRYLTNMQNFQSFSAMGLPHRATLHINENMRDTPCYPHIMEYGCAAVENFYKTMVGDAFKHVHEKAVRLASGSRQSQHGNAVGLQAPDTARSIRLNCFLS